MYVVIRGCCYECLLLFVCVVAMCVLLLFVDVVVVDVVVVL